MNRIECSNCGEIVETSVTRVTFPFMCTSCISDKLDGYESALRHHSDEDSYYDDCDQDYGDMAPASENLLGISMEEVLGTLNPTDALIADLKAQNERLTARLEGLTKWAAGLSETKAALKQSQREVLEYQKQVDELKDKTDVYREFIDGVADAVRKAADAMVSLR